MGFSELRMGGVPSKAAPSRWLSRERRGRRESRVPLILVASSIAASLPQLLALGIIERSGREPRRPPLAQNLDLEGGAILEEGRLHIAQRQALAGAVAIAARGDVARELAVAIDRFAAEAIGIGPVGLDGEARQALPRACLRIGCRGLAADEIALVEPDEAAEIRFEGAVIGGEVRTPARKAFLDAAGQQRAGADMAQAQIATLAPELVIDAALIFGRHVDLIA